MLYDLKCSLIKMVLNWRDDGNLIAKANIKQTRLETSKKIPL